MSSDTTQKKMRILLLGTVRPAHKILKSMGHEIIFFVKNKAALAADITFGYHSIFYFDDEATEDDFLAHAKLINQQGKIDAVCTYNDDLQRHAIKITQALGLDFPVNEETYENVYNKNLTREILAKQNIDNTAHCVADKASNAIDFANENGFPIIVKPLAATGSLDVRKLNNSTELNAALADVNYPVLVEEFLEGDEFSVEAITEDGVTFVVGITKKFKDAHNYVELGHVVPAPLNDDAQYSINTFVKEVVKAVGIHNGPSHTEVMLTPKGPRLIETHTRLGGDRIFELVKLATGIDLLKLTIEQSLGQKIADKIPTKITSTRNAAIAFHAPSFDTKFKIEKVENVAKLDSLACVETYVIMKNVGDTVGHLDSSFERAAFCIVTSETQEDTFATALDAINSLKYLYSVAR
jgi:biotin carboxylase